MQFEVFTVPAAGGEAMAALNKFLASHRVVSVEKHLVSLVANTPAWVFCVEYLGGPAPYAGITGSGATTASGKIDYKTVLNADDFILFSRLRDMRKAISEREKVPAYAIFTNEQLAEVVRQRVQTTSALGKIDGIGGSRIEKYGPAVLEVMQPLKWPEANTVVVAADKTGPTESNETPF